MECEVTREREKALRERAGKVLARHWQEHAQVVVHRIEGMVWLSFKLYENASLAFREQCRRDE